MKKVIISVIILIVLALRAVLGIRLVNEGSPRSHETTREGTEIISEALSWYRGGEKISGKIFKPCDENGVFDTSFGARPLVVFFHDPMKTASAGKLIARLVPMGVIGYSVDCPAKAEDMSFLISKMGKQEYVDKDRIFIIADSSSSDKAVNALLKVGRKTAGAILLEPRLQGKAGWTTHHCIVEFKGKWYLFHHDSVPSGKTWLRSLKVCELHYNADGTIQTIEG